MMIFTEEYQRFTFDDESWVILKYDDETAYQERIKKLPETKGVDFIGIHKKNLFFIEAKDFRDHRIENQNRLVNEELAVEIGQKVRDTISGIIGAYRTSDPNKWESFAKILTNDHKTIHVVVWLEFNLPSQSQARQKVRASVDSQVFKRKLFWLTPHVLVTNQANSNLPHVTVANLPRP